MPGTLEDGIRDLLRQAGIGPVHEFERLAGGLVNDVFRIDRELIVRVGNGRDGDEFPKTASVLRGVAGRIPAPQLVHVDFSRSHVPGNVLVYRAIEGELLSALWPGLSASERARYGCEVGRILERIHRTPVETVPELGGQDPWPERTARAIDASLRRCSDAGAFPAAYLDRMRDFAARNLGALDGAAAPVLVHCDVHWANVLVHEGEISALLDFDDVRLAPAEADWWELLIATGAADDAATDIDWFTREFGSRLSAPGCLERYVLEEILEIVKLLTEDQAWIGRREAQREAHQAYQQSFESDLFAELHARVTTTRATRA